MIAALFGLLPLLLDNLDVVGSLGGVVGVAGTALFGGWKKWAALGAVVVALGGWAVVREIQLAHRDADLARSDRDRDIALAANKHLADEIRAVTEARDSQARRAAAAARDLAAARAAIAGNTSAIIEEVHHAATPADDAPVPPGMRAALRGLRERYGAADGQ